MWLPWSITLWNTAIGNVTKTDGDVGTWRFPYPLSTNQSQSTIAFRVPYGTYNYEVIMVFGSMFGKVNFSPSNPLPVGINVELVGRSTGTV